MECHKVKRLIVVSNRVQPPSEDEPGNQGGLTVALSTVLRESNGIWFGWSGGETESFTGHINFQKSAGVTTATVDLEPQDIQEYYDGFANRTLWPLFHYRVSLAEFERGFVDGYERVNTRFADTLVPLIASDDLVWVHDYHLIPLGQRLRERGVKNRIGFFLHIPWPPMRLMVSLPNHQELVESLFAYDVVGFHPGLAGKLHRLCPRPDGRDRGRGRHDHLERAHDPRRGLPDRHRRARICRDRQWPGGRNDAPAHGGKRRRPCDDRGGGSPRLFQGIAGTLHRL
jgi:trehalose-6-phosphate synthase